MCPPLAFVIGCPTFNWYNVSFCMVVKVTRMCISGPGVRWLRNSPVLGYSGQLHTNVVAMHEYLFGNRASILLLALHP